MLSGISSENTRDFFRLTNVTKIKIAKFHYFVIYVLRIQNGMEYTEP